MGNIPLSGQVPEIQVIPNNNPEESSILRHPSWNKLDYTGMNTLHESFNTSVSKYSSNKCLGWRPKKDEPFEWMSYKQVQERSLNFGSGLISRGMNDENGRLGLYAINRPEWIISEQACYAYSFAPVALYDTLGPLACSFIIQDAGIEFIVSSSDKILLLLSHPEALKNIKLIISLDIITDELRNEAKKHKVEIAHFTDIENEGKISRRPTNPPSKDTIATICYTSGVTGDPKGVLLSHYNFTSQILSGRNILGTHHLTEKDIHVSYLPLAHVFERVVANAVLATGGGIGFYFSFLSLFNDIAVLKPTVFVSVPRVLNTLYEKTMALALSNGPVQSTMFQLAYSAKTDGLVEGFLTHGVWDHIVFSEVKAKLGGRVRLILTGSAPISGHVLEFLRICFSCPVIEGYGQTESCAAICSTCPNSTEIGNVGFPSPCVEVKLKSHPSLGYTINDKPSPRGELLYRGPVCSLGYYKLEEKSNELRDKDGWYYSGDICELQPNFSIKVIDRVKNLFKLSIGEYIAPEKLECIYLESPYISQIFVHGDSLKSSIVAICVPCADTLSQWAKDNNQEFDMVKLCVDASVIQMILKNLESVGKENKVRGFEIIKAIHLHPKPFTMEGDLLTATHKIKRHTARNYFKTEIEDLYRNL